MQPRLEWARWKRWMFVAGTVASTQLLVQCINAITGFLIVRSLTKTDYAWFTVTNTAAAMLATIGDSGLSSGLLAEGGRVWQDRIKFSSLLTTALRLRLTIVAIAALVSVPWAFWALNSMHAPIVVALSLLVVSLAASVPAAETVVLSIVPRLRTEVRVQQLSDVLGASIRLVLSALALIVLPATLLLVAAVAISQWAQVFFMRSHVSGVLDLRAAPSAETRATLLRMVRQLWFPMAFSCFQSQIGTVVLGMFGRTSSVAELGALSRFGVVFSVLLSVVHHLVAPALARSQSPNALVGLIARSLTALAVACCILTFVAWLLPDVLLGVLGAGYAGLRTELVLLFVYQSCGVLLIYVWTLNSARGWVGQSWLTPPVTLMTQVVLLKFISVSTLSGVLWFMIGSQAPPLIVLLWMTWTGMRRWRAGSARPIHVT